MNEQFLSDLHEAPRPEFADALFRRINQPMKNPTNTFRHIALGSSLGALILILVLLFSPTVRVYAQNLFVQIGHLFVSHEPTYAEQFEARIHRGEPTTIPSASTEAIEWQAPPNLSLTEASALAGFPVAEIGALPQGLTLAARFVTPPDQENRYTRITTTYGSKALNVVFSQTVYQTDAEAQELPSGAATITPVMVQNQDGLWIEHLRLSTYVDENNKVVERYANLLVWTKDDSEYWLQSSPGLSQVDMLALAESIYP